MNKDEEGLLLGLSVRQPFAGLILEGRKNIEIRNWAPVNRCDLLITASKGKKLGPCNRTTTLITGVEMCIVELLDCVILQPEHLPGACVNAFDLERLGFQLGKDWAWLLGPPTPVRHDRIHGMQKLFRLPEHVREKHGYRFDDSTPFYNR